ncbi:hypothetical protein [Mesonia aestuariivivens]|uniref:Redox-active disulfide protein 2 n=1 Tax=Mesonia aestuariivivens TaxID=2796128 RepID=A0ABS6VYM1_9FLAO|nr:hypothetical protein [Mesonia aestuariivivens]MBW2960681.1 hypothetical protein [Mesonia aestuariivivens]
MEYEKKLKNLSDEELIKEHKNKSIIFGIFLGLVTIMVISSIITIIKNKIIATTFMPLAFFPLLLIFWNGFKKVRKEKNFRKLK